MNKVLELEVAGTHGNDAEQDAETFDDASEHATEDEQDEDEDDAAEEEAARLAEAEAKRQRAEAERQATVARERKAAADAAAAAEAARPKRPSKPYFSTLPVRCWGCRGGSRLGTKRKKTGREKGAGEERNKD